jgi:hypothetical protein
MMKDTTLVLSVLSAMFLSGASAAHAADAKALNPDLSLSGLFAFSQFNQEEPLVFEGGHDPKVNGFNIQQVELSLGAAVDPYFRADSAIVLVPENGETKIEIEEAYATSLGLPAGLQLKAGQFFSAFGRQNPTHPHAWTFVNKPLVSGRMFGGDGLRNVGAQLSWLTPLPWYAEIIASAQNATGETAESFNSPYDDPANPGTTLQNPQRSAQDLLTLVRLANSIDLSDELSLVFGGSYAVGPNRTGTLADARRTKILGGDIYLKLRDPGSMAYFFLQAEFMRRLYDDLTSGMLTDDGYYVEGGWKLPEPMGRWLVGFRYDHVSARANAVDVSGTGLDRDARYRISPVVTYLPSEFSKVRIQYDRDKPEGFASPQHVVTVQLEFGIGAHAAHPF